MSAPPTEAKTDFRRLSKAYVEAHARDFTALIARWEHGDWREENFTSDVEKKWEYSYGFFRGERLVGFCMASGKIPGAYYVHLLFVAEEHRAFGVGRDFFAVCIDHCRGLGLRSIDLKCPLSNTRGLRFYESLGFRVVDSDGADQTLSLALASP